MTWVTGLVLYTLIWWTALFAVLPIGTRAVEVADTHSGWRGAPARTRILFKVIVTTLVSAVIWLGLWFVITSELFSFRQGFLAMPSG